MFFAECERARHSDHHQRDESDRDAASATVLLFVLPACGILGDLIKHRRIGRVLGRGYQLLIPAEELIGIFIVLRFGGLAL